MKFFEHSAKKVFESEGIKILEGHVVYSPEEAMEVATEFGRPIVLKSQVLVGGRGKAGGIKFADNPGEAFEIANELLKLEIKGEKVKHLLIEEKANIKQIIICDNCEDSGIIPKDLMYEIAKNR